MSHHIVAADGLCFTYPDGTEVLKGISFRITHGESVALVGENGAGKSTLLQHLSGCLNAGEGAVTVGNLTVTPQTAARVRQTVGMVFQNPEDQLFMPTVYDDVAFGPLNAGLQGNDLDRVVMHALETMGASHLRNRPPYKLSGGEKRSVAIAAVLSMSPDILVMDEPTASLDPRSRSRLIRLLQTFHHTKIIATHDLDMVLDLCERTIVLHNGRVAADGPTREIMENVKLLEESGLEKPLKMQ